ncbi:ROK family transcriptional regulator [Aggregatilinea lenta]|uniref:ROK family transcriptional regulator n=1 Tax=Aggregatilinea lenta TaxID=913108 RepID=UPI000E5A8CAE|nr:ROK family protein [Aggregatilinea lenta]
MQADVQTQLREQNLTTILRTMKQTAPVSRAQLAALTQLNKTTVSSLVEELIGLGLIHETGLDTSGGGRPATLLELNPQAEHAIGVEIGDGFVLVVLCDLTGHIIWRGIVETEFKAAPDDVITQAFALVDKAVVISRSHGEVLLGLGVVLSGIVDVDAGVLRFSPGFQWHDIPVGQLFEDHIGLPVYVENNANAAAIGEHFFGAAHASADFIFILAGIGIGGGLFLNGDIYRGAVGMAGELGHANFMQGGNLPCRCGDRGCWETTANQMSLINRVRAALDAGQPSILHQIIEATGQPLNFSTIHDAADAGDAVALDALAETGMALGTGIAAIINIFNPGQVVIGGSMSRASEYLLPAIQAMIDQHALTQAREHVRVVVSEFGENAIAVGAATLAIRDALANPRSVKR